MPTNTAGVMARRALGRRGGAAAIDVLTLYRARRAARRPVAARRGPQPGVDAGRRPRRQAGASTTRPASTPASTTTRRPSSPCATSTASCASPGPASLTALARTARGSEPARVAAEVARLLARQWYDEGDLLARGRRASPPRPARPPARASSSTSPSACGRSSTACSRPSPSTADVAPPRSASPATPTPTPPSPRSPRALAGHPLPAGADGAVRPTGRVDVVSTTDADDEVRLAVRAVARRRPAPARRSTASPCCSRPTGRTPASSSTSSTPPASRGTAGPGTDRRRADGAARAHRAARARSARPAPHDADDAARRRPGPRRRRPAPCRPPGGSASGAPPASSATPTGRPTCRATPPSARATARRRGRRRGGRGAAGVRRPSCGRALGDPADVRPWAEWADVVARSGSSAGSGRAGSTASRAPSATAWEQTWRVLDRLGHLDSIGQPVTRAEFRATFVAELEITPGRHGKVGDGVHVSTLAGAAGLDVDLAVVLGAADGLVPPPPGRRPAARRPRARTPPGWRAPTSGPRPSTASSSPPSRRTPAASRHRPARRPAGDGRRTTRRAGSSPLADAAGRIAGARSTPTPTAWPRPSSRCRPPSTASASCGPACAPATTSATCRLAADDAVLRRALALRDARAERRVHRVRRRPVQPRPLPRSPATVSPTRIETWAALPARLLRAATCSASARSTSPRPSRR